jgi:hypothetical protein
MVTGYCACEIHQGKKYEEGLEQHHLAQRAQYPEFADDTNNIIYVCPSCHRYKIHKNGNLKELSTYGEGLRYEFLKGKGIVPSMTRNSASPTPAISSSSSSNNSLNSLSVFFILLIYGCCVYSFGRTFGWSWWVIPGGALLLAIIAAVLIGALYILYKVTNYLWTNKGRLWYTMKDMIFSAEEND